MNTGTNNQGMFRGALDKVRSKLIAAIVPRHTRRAIFACSLAAKFVPDDRKLHQELARKLVQDLNLNCAYSSMLAPMSWSKWIWKSLPEIDFSKGQQKDLTQVAGKVVRSAPASLFYGNPRVMEEDVLNTLKAVKDMKA